MRGRRAAAWLIDTAPLWLAMLLVGPLGLIHALALRQEASQGVGLFDPSDAGAIGRDGWGWMARQVTRALLLVFGWGIVQLSALLAARRTAGKSLLGLGLRSAGGPAARGRVLAREMSRFALLAALPPAYAFFAHPRLSGGVRGVHEFFAQRSAPPLEPGSVQRTLIVIGGLMIAAICVTLWEVVLVAANPAARTLGDRVARTHVVRREA